MSENLVSDILNKLLANVMNTDVAAIRLAHYSKTKAFDLNANHDAVIAVLKALFHELSDEELNAVFQEAIQFAK